MLIISLPLNELSLKHAVPNNYTLTQVVNSLISKWLRTEIPNLLDYVNPFLGSKIFMGPHETIAQYSIHKLRKHVMTNNCYTFNNTFKYINILLIHIYI